MEAPFPASPAPVADATEHAAVEATSHTYLGQWNRLVSTTNWEKGRIICQWREALIAAGAPPTSYTDEAWSRRVGNVTPQHTGRLRRVFDRFAATREAYAGLFWSHFQVALDWNDAEMWLEGAVQNGWSVAEVQAERWRTLGGHLEEKPDEAPPMAEVDEDHSPLADESAEAISASPAQVQPDESWTDPPEADGQQSGEPALPAENYSEEALAEPLRPFEDLPTLPADLSDALEAFKLAILHHKISGWQEVSRDNLLQVLDSLRDLALAPGE